jgi:hypothetical protein
MHEFEFEVRISDQIQTVKMAIGRNLKLYLNIMNSLWKKIAPDGPVVENSLSTHAKFEVRTRKTDGFYCRAS